MAMDSLLAHESCEVAFLRGATTAVFEPCGVAQGNNCSERHQHVILCPANVKVVKPTK